MRLRPTPDSLTERHCPSPRSPQLSSPQLDSAWLSSVQLCSALVANSNAWKASYFHASVRRRSQSNSDTEVTRTRVSWLTCTRYSAARRASSPAHLCAAPTHRTIRPAQRRHAGRSGSTPECSTGRISRVTRAAASSLFSERNARTKKCLKQRKRQIFHKTWDHP